ncbi:MAG: phosphatase PAP2 family protein [Desulfobacteraceae bacterium]|nr:phosphatase PAP2 family protein [Desulfobacteraceae bacterium]MBC2756653.1 phosphatase PAP2 family protein [Desulfobacteraceae bacterium]
MGDGPFWLLVVFVAALIRQFINIDSFYQLSILLMFGLMISNIAFVLCKTKVKRKRPYANGELQQHLQIEIKNRDPGHGSKELESFPSGHVLWTTLCVSLIYSQFGYISLILFGWMIPTMVYLRIYLGVHYPSDVLVALALGSVNVLITLLLAPGLLEYLNGLRNNTSFLLGYWVFIVAFLIVGFKSWLKRV